MSDFKSSCPHCSQHLQCDERFAGRQIQCPQCQHLIRIPPVPGKTALYNPESGLTWNTFVAPSPKPRNRFGPDPSQPLEAPSQ